MKPTTADTLDYGLCFAPPLHIPTLEELAREYRFQGYIAGTAKERSQYKWMAQILEDRITREQRLQAQEATHADH